MEDALKNPGDLLTRLVNRFEEAEDSSYSARIEAERDRDYYDGRQLSAEEIAALKKRGQPQIVINRIRRKVNWLKGIETNSRTDPRAFPRTPQHQQGAEAATDSIRFVVENTGFDQIRSRVWENMLVEGFGGAEVVHEERNGKAEVVINFYRWDRLFFDPHSDHHDFSDARYLGAVVWTDADELIREYPDQKGKIEGLFHEASGETFGDKPKYAIWSDVSRRRVRLLVMYYRDGDQWHWAKFHRGDILANGPVEYVDEDGKSVCPLIMQSLYVDRDNDRYGVVRDMVGPQDEINKRRSKALHLLTMRQTIGEKGAVDSITAMKRELARPDGHVEVEPEARFELLNTNDLASGQLGLLQEAKGEIDMMGANSALSGETGESSSGRAVLARQQGGMVEIASELDALGHFTKRCYRAIWNRIRQTWTEERWIRVTDDEKNVRFVGMNRPVTLGEQLSQMPDEQVVMYAQQMGLVPNDPRLGAVVGYDNVVESLDVDIQIEEVPDQVTLAGETFEQLVNISTAMPGAVPPEILVESAPGIKRDVKDKLLERMEQAAQASMQPPDPMVKAGEIAQIEKIASETQLNNARAAQAAAQLNPYGVAAAG